MGKGIVSTAYFLENLIQKLRHVGIHGKVALLLIKF
uniref:Uncharacterized protein n=1 Tax=Arundo donax TaxID=35708 RepID=A0A0A8ZFT9_ARUDO